jgi:hypothetical protein
VPFKRNLRRYNQDEMIELEEKEEDEEAALALAKEQSTKDALYAAANMSGVEDLFERMLTKDPEYAKLRYIPNKERPELVEGLEVGTAVQVEVPFQPFQPFQQLFQQPFQQPLQQPFQQPFQQQPFHQPLQPPGFNP